MENIIPVKVGAGNKVHAGYVKTYIKKGRIEIAKYDYICGSGKSSMAHSFHNTTARRMPDGTQITCDKCKKALETL